jgi:exosome complex component MTR3
LDGRFPEQLRSLVIKPNVLTEAKGSCYLELGNTKLTCAIYGPRLSGKQGKTYSNRGSVYCEVDLLPFAQEKRRGFQRENDEVELAALLQDTLTPALRLETFPNSTVDCYINVLEADGSVLAASITAASVAITLAGIEMNDLVIGASFAAASSTLLVDPNASEESAAASKFTVGQMVNSGNIAQLFLIGPLDNALLREAMIMSHEVVAAIHDYIKTLFVNQ